MAINYAALKTEIENDPASLGYAAPLAAGSDNIIADLLNAVTTWDIPRDLIPAYEVIDATTPADYTALSAGEKERYAAITGAGQVNVKNTNVRAAFAAMFGAATPTRAALVLLQNRKGSRAEALFGAGTVIHHSDVAQALQRIT